jgi:hypothetical protein
MNSELSKRLEPFYEAACAWDEHLQSLGTEEVNKIFADHNLYWETYKKFCDSYNKEKQNV